ncbi:MAG TPA: methionyl-tRNA formyltransferase [Abditibacteriaceae bacterium]|jgi:methionyl-tRNA formyltransferase
MKIAFMGTPALAVPFLEALHREHEIALVVTQPDKPAGRGKGLAASPVKEYAVQHRLPLAQPQRARDEEFIKVLREVSAQAIAVVAFGQILPRAILDMPPNGCVNVHFSLLPRWRGAAPVQHALLAGDAVTGVTVQHMAEKLDSGDIIIQREWPIEPDDTTADLWQKLTAPGVEALVDALHLLQNGKGNAPRTPQDENNITLASMLRKEDGQIDWTQPAQEIVNRVRATNPWPGAYCSFRDRTLKVWRAAVAEGKSSSAAGHVVHSNENGVVVATGQGTVRLIEVQAEGRPRLSAAEWARGARLEDGQPLA